MITCHHCHLPIAGKDYEGFIGMGYPAVRYYHKECHVEARKAAPKLMSFFEQDRQQIESLKAQVVTLLRRLGEVEGRSIRANREADEALDAMRENVTFLAERLAQANGRLALRGSNADELVRVADQRTAEAEARVTEANVRAQNEYRHRLKAESEWRTCEGLLRHSEDQLKRAYAERNEYADRLKVERAKAKPDHDALLIVVGERDKAEAELAASKAANESMLAQWKQTRIDLDAALRRGTAAELALDEVRAMAKIATDNNAIAQQQMGDMRRQVIEMRYRRKGRRK